MDKLINCNISSQKSEKILLCYTLFISLIFLAFSPLVAFITGEGMGLFKDFFLILSSPSKLVTDYFALGSVAATFLNVGLCGLACNALMRFCCSKVCASTLAGYLLVVAHCFFGLNLFNMWPTILGVLVFCLATKRKFSDNLNIAMVSTALGPCISDFTFRYFEGDAFVFGEPRFSLIGFIISLVFGIIAGFMVPALIPGTAAMHRGYSLYKAGLAIGIMGIFVHAIMYPTLGIETPSAITVNNSGYSPYDSMHYLIIYSLFIVVFGVTLICGYILNGKSFKGYKALINSTGYGIDFIDKFGMPLCLINIAVYGFCIVGYIGAVSLISYLLPFLPDGSGLSAATVGVTFGAITFAADGQHPKNVWPIGLGYFILFGFASLICGVTHLEIPWTLSSQVYISSFAFATGLCPFAGKYGWKVGTVAGLASATICSITSAMHGGFVLYNGGFTAGLTALILLPILDFYKIKERFDSDI